MSKAWEIATHIAEDAAPLVANAAVFLASDEAKAIHGACLVVDGGVHG
jgi:enoyl-[acyl-carrier-protein] reductase (NADH)